MHSHLSIFWKLHGVVHHDDQRNYGHGEGTEKECSQLTIHHPVFTSSSPVCLISEAGRICTYNTETKFAVWLKALFVRLLGCSGCDTVGWKRCNLVPRVFHLPTREERLWFRLVTCFFFFIDSKWPDFWLLYAIVVSLTQKPFKLILPSRPHAGKIRPQHRELRALLFAKSVWVL